MKEYMNKKCYCLFAGIAAVLSSAPVYAGPLTEAEAIKVAQEFRAGDARMRKAAGAPMKLAYKAQSTAGTAFYIFNSGNNGGFTIVSGDDSMPAILGYSDSGAFVAEDMPENMRAWLNSYIRQAEYVVSGGYRPGAEKADTRKDVAPILTAEWDQDAPYYDLCPMQGSKRTYTGCVATAMAQVMHHFQWPEQAKGTCYFNGQNYVLSTIYEWDRMLDKYKNGNYTDAQGQAVAQLMFDCGRSVDMIYGTDGSAAMSHTMQPAMINNFSYDEGVSYSERRYFTDEEWLDLMYTEMAEGRPVLYGGTSDSGGHQFVADGYKQGGFFHINWGWSGVCNGYYLLDALAPSEQGIGGGSGGESFDYDQDAVFGIRKPAGGKRQISICGTGDFSVGNSQNRNEDMFTITNSFLVNENGQRISGFINFTGMTFETAPGVRLTNVETGEITDLKYPQLQEFKFWQSVVSMYPIDMSSVKDGKYVIYPYSFDAAGTPALTRCPANKECFMLLDVKDGNRKYSYLDENPGFTLNALSVTLSSSSISLKPGEEYVLSAEVGPAYASLHGVEWSSSDSKVAIVENGVVKAVSGGKATVTAVAADGSGVSASCEVEVEGGLGVKDVVLGQDSYQVYDVMGNCLIRNGNSRDIERLPRGIFIVNGKKIFVTK